MMSPPQAQMRVMAQKDQRIPVEARQASAFHWLRRFHYTDLRRQA
jgi:hypothetical protein